MYPDFLPLPVRDSYAGQPELEPRRFQMDDNQYSQMRIGNRNPFVYTLAWKLNYLQARLFSAWFKFEAMYGTVEMEIPFSSKTIKVKAVTGEPTYTPIGSGWNVQLIVRELLEAPTMPTVASLPEWPASLPELESNGFSLIQNTPFVSPDITNGLQAQRIRFADKRVAYTGSVILDPVQRETFWDFWRDALLNGQRWFDAPFASPEFTGHKKARLAAVPAESPNASWFTINLQLETSRMPIMDYVDYASYGTIGHWVETGYYDEGYVI